jgi:hypothetical protein
MSQDETDSKLINNKLSQSVAKSPKGESECRMTKNANMQRIRIEGGHAWTLKGKCRFCGMTRVLFKMQNRPDCQWPSIKEQTRRKPQASDKARED